MGFELGSVEELGFKLRSVEVGLNWNWDWRR